MKKLIKNSIKGFLNLFSKNALPTEKESPKMAPKDPMDWRLTKNSGKWWTDQYCPNCKKSTTHEERMADICNGCGSFGRMTNYRSSRKIWNGEKWVTQRKYGNGPNDFSIEDN